MRCLLTHKVNAHVQIATRWRGVDVMTSYHISMALWRHSLFTIFLVGSPPTAWHQGRPMASITTHSVRVCLLLVCCLKLTALFQSSPPPLQTETAVPPSGQQGESNERTRVRQGSYQRKAAAGPGDGPSDPNISGTSPTSPTSRVPWKDQVVGKPIVLFQAADCLNQKFSSFCKGMCTCTGPKHLTHIMRE